MNSTPQTLEEAGAMPAVNPTEAPWVPSPPPRHHHRPPGAFRMEFQRAVPKYISAAVLDPFRKLALPLARWLAGTHVSLPSDDPDKHAVPVEVSKTSLATIILSMTLGPIVFVMLLPLILILLPAFLVIGFLGLLATAFSFDEPTRRSLPA